MTVCQIVTKVISGEKALDNLSAYHHQRVLIVCDPFLSENGTIHLITEQFDCSNEIHVFSDTVPDPTMDVIVKAVAQAQRIQPTLIIGFGGGAAIDTAKGVKYFAVKGKAVTEKPVFIAIPTTSGTGSEMTAFAVFTETENHRKIALVDDIMHADIAILDPQLTLTVPPSVTANTGFDVITHAIEAYVSKSASPFTDDVACVSLELALKFLPICYHQGRDIEARENMHTASNLAGTAFDLSGLGLAHSMAHQLGGMYHLPHGLACAICLPLSIRYNSAIPDVCNKYAELARKVGLSLRSMSDKDSVAILIAVLEEMMASMNMPLSMRQIKNAPTWETYKASIPELVQNALVDRCLPENQRTLTVKDATELFKQAY